MTEKINPKLTEKCEYGVERRIATQHTYCASCEYLAVYPSIPARACGFWRTIYITQLLPPSLSPEQVYEKVF